MTLWTPGGEHPVDRDPSPDDPSAARPGLGDAGSRSDDRTDLSPEEREEAARISAEMDAVRRQLATVPPWVVIANHAMGLYELAAIHLSADPPALSEAKLAIDGMGALVDGLAGRLGENEPTLRDALGQLRLAYVQLSGSTGTAESPA